MRHACAIWRGLGGILDTRIGKRFKRIIVCAIIHHVIQRTERQLGDFGPSGKGELDPDAGMPKHSNQSINTESVDLSSDQVAHPWLGHPKQTCSLSLCESPRADKFAELNHQP